MNLRNLFGIGLLLLPFFSCKKTSSNPNAGGVNLADTVPSGIYVTGFTITNDWGTSVYWKDGKINILPNNYPSIANAITVKDTNIIIGGSSTEFNDAYQATSWTNGVKSLLTDSVSFAYGVLANNNNIYFAGYTAPGIFTTSSTAVYWKNNTEVKLPGNGLPGRAYGIAASGADIYIVGVLNLQNAVFWKNGVLNSLPSGPASASWASAIVTNGNDIYIAGYVTYGHKITQAAYWKNGILTLFGDTSSNSKAEAIGINGSDVYVVGETNVDTGSGYSVATFWKNGVATTLTGGSNLSTATAITFHGTDVYIAGSYPNGACYWKNNVITGLGEGGGTGIMVVANKKN